MARYFSIQFFLFFFFFNFTQAQTTQTIKGIVTDKYSSIPLYNVAIEVINKKSKIGTVTNNKGEFELNNLTPGNYTLSFTIIGYTPVTVEKLTLTSGKQLNINILMEEASDILNEIVITSHSKNKTINNFTSLSAQSFSVKETEKYAGTFGDPARMALNFSGITTAGDARNDIIIRGNSPIGVLWRIDGVEVNNPNHYASTGTTGGSVSIINNNTLQNSDFFISAFPAEYGNAFSGVFDLNLRNGNKNKYELTGQIGYNGVEAMIEGPFNEKYDGSFLLSYRYSVLSLLDKINPEETKEAVPNYQDLTFKLNFPLKKNNLSVFGIGGLSNINFLAEKLPDDAEQYSLSKERDLYNESNLGIIGANYKHLLNDNSYLNYNISYSTSEIITKIDSVKTATNSTPKKTKPFFRSKNKDDKLNFSLSYNNKINRRNIFKSGITFQRQYASYIDSASINYKRLDLTTNTLMDTIGFIKTIDITNGKLDNLKVYTQWHHRFSKAFKMNLGINFQKILLNNQSSIEPRINFSYNLSKNKKIALGYGLHSKIPPIINYFALSNGEIDEIISDKPALTNLDLSFIKSHHFVIGYKHKFNRNLHLNIETYYHYLFNIPIERTPSNFSLINTGAAFAPVYRTNLINQGTGKNYGIDFSIERFLYKKWYAKLNASIFDSKYRGSDKIERSTAFASNYSFKGLGGYQHKIDKNLSANFNTTINYSGGSRKKHIDLKQSILKNRTIYDDEKIYTTREDDYFRLDFRISLQRNKDNYSEELGIDFINATNHKNTYSREFDPNTGNISKNYQQKFLAMVMYRIHF
ncbi:putative TonB-dependent receptor [Tenacibaculum sp. 190524A02b]|uniref:TonB-dependent receptor n=1 Tax=Tenacibaculum vairaonense TaxID=3137860 RepID=A0ABP1F6K6_9FLAO